MKRIEKAATNREEGARDAEHGRNRVGDRLRDSSRSGLDVLRGS